MAYDFVLLAVHVEISHSLSAQAVLQSLGNIAYARAEHAGLIAVDADTCLGAVELEVGKTYAYSFWAKSESGLNVQFICQNER